MSEEDTSRSETLRERGFTPGIPVFVSYPKFAVEDMKSAMFDSPFSTPKTLPIMRSCIDVVQVVVTMMRPVYVVDDPESRDQGYPLYGENPDWWLEGWIVDGQSTYDKPGVAVRIYAISGTFGEVDELLMQVTSTHLRPDGLIVSQHEEDC